MKSGPGLLPLVKRLLAAAVLLCCAPPARGEFISSGGFPAGTMVSATSGDIRIEDIIPGDKILAFSEENLVQSEVRDVYQKKTLLFTIKTNKGNLVTTRYHLLLSWKGFVEAQKIKPGEELAVLKNGRRIWARVLSAKAGKTGLVYNIETGPPHTFIANDFLVHNENGPARAGAPATAAAIALAAVFIFFSLKKRPAGRRTTAPGTAAR